MSFITSLNPYCRRKDSQSPPVDVFYYMPAARDWILKRYESDPDHMHTASGGTALGSCESRECRRNVFALFKHSFHLPNYLTDKTLVLWVN